jgi:hypothetical protein
MGVRQHEAAFILESLRTGATLGRCITIGRQWLLCTREELERVLALHSRVCTDTQLSAIFQRGSQDDALFSEQLLLQWGAETVESVDYSDFEGATHVVDLNANLPVSLAGRYDSIIDCGTMEHVFDIAAAMANILRLARVGGCYIACLPANNCMGHGFYQFSPEFFYGVLRPENGFRVELMLLSEIRGEPTFYVVPNPTVVGRRVEICNDVETYLFVFARRIDDVPARVVAYQADYVAAWSPPTTPQQRTYWGAIKRLVPRQVRQSIRRVLPSRSTPSKHLNSLKKLR